VHRLNSAPAHLAAQPAQTDVSRRTLLRRAAVTAGGLAAAAALSDLIAACGSGSSTPASAGASAAGATASGSASLGTVALQLSWTKNVAYGGSFLADYLGYYRGHGVDVDILSGGPTVSGIPILVSGKALVAISDPATTSEAVAQEASLAVVAAGYQINPECIMSLASNPIKTPADLIGKKIGVGSSDEPDWQAFLKANNIPASKVDTVPAGFDPSPVASGEWDGYLAFANNEPPGFAAKGIKTQLLLFQDYGLPELNEIYIVTTDTLNNPQQRKKAAAFLAGEIQGWTKAVSDPSLAAQVTVDKYATGLGLDYQGEYLAALATNRVTVSSETKAHGVLSFNESQVAQTIETLARAGVKASASLFDASLLSDAHALII
jgi:ABC-type nitrate/sulfonate/bicarbonate transport system substrate-binding protein